MYYNYLDQVDPEIAQAIRDEASRQQNKIDSIRERMCDSFCRVPYTIESPEIMRAVCENACPLNELEASE